MAAMRAARKADLDVMSAVCVRSKAHWGHDAAFMEACRNELTLRDEDLTHTQLQLVEDEGRVVAVAQLGVEGDEAEIWKLFVDPDHMARGHGRGLMDWMVAVAGAEGAKRLRIEADPDARAFYETFGARLVGFTPSSSTTGRDLPLLYIDL